ncbi:hypothetical protein FEC33_19065, partial [Acinetobacter baumannii]
MFLFTARFVKSPRGRLLLVLNGYTYYCMRKQFATNYWWCTSGMSCKMRITTTKEGNIVRIHKNGHDHIPPEFIIRDGV